MDFQERTIQTFVADNGRAPFDVWVGGMRDKRIKARILTRMIAFV